MTNVASKWNGIRPLTDMQKAIASVMTQDRILGNVAGFPKIKPKSRLSRDRRVDGRAYRQDVDSIITTRSVADVALLSSTLPGEHTPSFIKPRETCGIVDVDVVDPTDWSSMTTTVDKTGTLFCPTPATLATRLSITIAAEVASGSPIFERYSYDRSTGLLSLTFPAAFSGRITFSYQWGDQSLRLAAAAP